MNDPKWIEWRRNGIGGSDIAAVLGLSPWRTQFDVWMEKTGRATSEPGSEAMEWGRRLEPVVLEAWAERSGARVLERDVRRVAEHSPVIRGTIDAIAELPAQRRKDGSGQVIVEIKTSRSAHDWREGVPIWYVTQAYWYLALTGMDRVVLPVLFDGSRLEVFEIETNPRVQERLVARALEWWEHHVVADHPPDPETALDVANLRALRQATGVIEASDELDSLIVSLAEIRSKIRSMERDAEELEKRIMTLMPTDAKTAVASTGARVTFVPPSVRSIIDTAALERELPEVAERFRKERRVAGYLRIYEAGGKS